MAITHRTDDPNSIIPDTSPNCPPRAGATKRSTATGRFQDGATVLRWIDCPRGEFKRGRGPCLVFRDSLREECRRSACPPGIITGGTVIGCPP